jgi:hypothetical protein
MRARQAAVRTGLRARLRFAGFGTMIVLAAVAIPACSGSTPSAGPSSFSPGASISSAPTTRSSGAAGGGTRTPRSPSASPSASRNRTASPSAEPSPSASYPTAAPATGGGGSAGFQNPLLLVLGGTALLAGAASLAYRRKLTRGH